MRTTNEVKRIMAFRESDHSGRVETVQPDGSKAAHYFLGMPSYCEPTSLEIVRGMTWGTAWVLNAITDHIFDKPLANIYESLENKINNKIYQHEEKCFDNYLSSKH